MRFRNVWGHLAASGRSANNSRRPSGGPHWGAGGAAGALLCPALQRILTHQQTTKRTDEGKKERQNESRTASGEPARNRTFRQASAHLRETAAVDRGRTAATAFPFFRVKFSRGPWRTARVSCRGCAPPCSGHTSHVARLLRPCVTSDMFSGMRGGPVSLAAHTHISKHSTDLPGAAAVKTAPAL